MTVSGGEDAGGDVGRPEPISVLHVDGDETVLSDTAAYIESTHPDVRVESHCDPGSALARLDEACIDCLVSEYALPASTGLELIATARDRQPGLPLVLFTDARPESIAADVLDTGIGGYVRKTADSTDYDRLVERIRIAVDPVRSRRRADRLTAVAGAVRAVHRLRSEETSPPALLERVVALLASAGPYVAVVAGSFDADTGVFVPEAWSGTDASPLGRTDEATITTSLLRAVRRTGEGHLRRNLTADPVDVGAPLLPGADYHSLLALPLLDDAEPVGALVVYGSDPSAFAAGERALLEAVADDVRFTVGSHDGRARTVDLEWYETVFETATDGLFLASAFEGEISIEHANPAQRRIWGVEDSDTGGRPLDAVVDDGRAGPIRDHLWLCVEQRASISYVYDLSGRTIRTNLSPVRTDGKVTHVVGVSLDITARSRIQTELELLHSVLRHDIRNDIQLVLGWATLLGDHVGETEADYVEKIRATGEHVIELTDIARDFVEAAVDDGDAMLEPQQLSAVLTAEVEKAAEIHEDAEYSFTDRAEGPTVLANEMLASVFRNVLNNAVQHNDATTPRVDVTLTREGDRAVVRVADNGPGIPPDRREVVFGEGERGHDSAGIGIGLYLVDTLVDLYGGSVWIGDADDGTTVVIALPTI